MPLSAKYPRARTALVAVVLAALCFSVGEGLRLLPPPYAPSDAGGRADSRADVSNADRARQNQFKPGSLGLPPQAQKDLQSKQTHYAPAAGCALPPPHQAPRRPGARRAARRDLSASVPGTAGRAPPRAA